MIFSGNVVGYINMEEVTMGWTKSLQDEGTECMTGYVSASFSRKTILHRLRDLVT